MKYFRQHHEATWIVLVCFTVGLVAGAMVPMPNLTTEYQSGHAAGYHAGWKDAMAVANKTLQSVYEHHDRMMESAKLPKE
jgi:uncharacterized protein (DUF1786 family)